MTEWKNSKLGDVLTLQRGFDLPEQSRKVGKFPIVASTDIAGTHNEFKVSGPGVVIGRSGSIGGGQFISKDFWPLNTTLQVNDFKANDVRYCYYLLKNIDFSIYNVGSGVPTLNRNHIHPHPVIVAPYIDQKAITSVLGALDDKIKNNYSINEFLTKIAQAIFKSWFVDFDPISTKIVGKTFANMDTETAAFFPKTFGDNGLPLGWTMGKIEDIVDRQRAGKLFSKKTVHKKGIIPVLDQSAADIIGFHNEEPSILASPSDRVITFANHTCVLRLIDFNFSAIQNVIPFKGKKYPTEWVFFASYNKQKFEEYKGHWPTFLVQPVILPDEKTSLAFTKIVEPIVSKISTNLSQNQTLIRLRDILLPKLLSGEIRVKDAEHEVEVAL